MGKLDSRLRLAILERDGFRCVYCGSDAAVAALEVDHILPRSLSGHDAPDNLVTACRTCNNAKRATILAADLVAIVSRPMPTWWGERRPRPVRAPSGRTRRVRPSVTAWCWGREPWWKERIGPFELSLYAEIDGTPMLGDVDPYPSDPFAWYCSELRRGHLALWESDAVPILWSVCAESARGLNTYEIADWDPILDKYPSLRAGWGRYFSEPEDRNGAPIDWADVPVNMGRFSGFERSIGWMPTIRDRAAPVRSLWIARQVAGVRSA